MSRRSEYWASCRRGGSAWGRGAVVLTALVYGFEDLFQRLLIQLDVVAGDRWRGGWRRQADRAARAGGRLRCDPRSAARPGAGRAVAQPADCQSASLGDYTRLRNLWRCIGTVADHRRRSARWLSLSDPGLWAMVSMAALMGGTMRSPLKDEIKVVLE
jgi:hypothetical protein